MSDFFENISPDNLVNVVRELTRRLKSLELREINSVGALDEISDNLGEIRAGRFIAATSGSEPTDADFSGAFVSAEGEEFHGDLYHIGGVNLGALQFGLSSADGKAYFMQGKAVIDAEGIDILGLNYPLLFQVANNNIGRKVKYGVGVLPNTDVPSGMISNTQPEGNECATNGGFDADLTGWVATQATWENGVCVIEAGGSIRTDESNLILLDNSKSLHLTMDLADRVIGASGTWTIKLDYSVSGVYLDSKTVYVGPSTKIDVILLPLPVATAGRLMISIAGAGGIVDNVSVKFFSESTVVIDDGGLLHKSSDYISRIHTTRSLMRPPCLGLSATAGTGGSLAAGTYKYIFTFVGKTGETRASDQISVTVAANGKVTLTLDRGAFLDIPGYGESPYRGWVDYINIYRTVAGGSTFYFLAQTNDSTYVDTGAVALNTNRQAPTIGTLCWMGKKPVVICENSGTQTHNSSGSWLTLGDASMVQTYDPAAMYDINNRRFYARVGGLYLIQAMGVFAQNATGIRGLRLIINGSVYAATIAAALPANQTYLNLAALALVDTASYFSFEFYQNSGGSLTFGASANQRFLLQASLIEYI